MRKAFRLFMVVLLAFSFVLTSCGGSNNTESKVPKETVELTWYCVADSQPDMEKICEEANKYLKDKLNVTIKAENFGWGETYTPKINPMLAAGNAGDIVFTSSWAANYAENARAGYFLALDEYLEKYPKITEVLGKDFLDGAAIDGVHYGLPCNKEKVHWWGVLLRKDLVDKYSIDTTKIKKLEDLEPYFSKIKEDYPDMYPLLNCQMEGPFKLLDWDTFSSDDVPGALYPESTDGKVVNQFLAPESIALYRKMREYYLKGWIHPDAATQENFTDEFRTGKYFAVVQSMKPGKGDEMSKTFEIPVVQVDMTPIRKTNRETIGALTAIPKNSKNPEIAFRFIEMLYTDKYLKNLFNYGIENVHYKFVDKEKGIVKLTDDAGNPMNKGFNLAGQGWRFGDNYIDYIVEGNDPMQFEKFKEVNEKGIPLQSLGFVFDPKGFETEQSQCQAAVQNHYKQLFTGSVDVDSEIKAFENELKAAGVDKLIAEMERQYKEWLKKTGK